MKQKQAEQGLATRAGGQGKGLGPESSPISPVPGSGAARR